MSFPQPGLTKEPGPSAREGTSALARPVTDLWGVGPERSAQLARLGVSSIEDLLLHRPARHEDRRNVHPIRDLKKGETAMARGKIVALGVKWFRYRTKSIFELVVDDGTARLHCRWWNLPFLEQQYSVGEEVVFFGKLKESKPRTMEHPEVEVVEGGEAASIHLRRITPIYPLTEGLPQRWLRSLIWRTLQQFASQLEGTARLPWATDSKKSSFALSRAEAIRQLHFPDELDNVERARRRLALDEFFELQTRIQRRRHNLETRAQALPCRGDNRLIRPFLAQLGFRLTESQTAVLRQMRADMAGAHPMRRLLQGDVGSGKTVVAACCALMALESGYDVALMAPTEILAEQHFHNFTRWFQALKIGVDLRTGSQKKDKHSTPTASGPMLTVGTHALIKAGFTPSNLGLVIIDEQHRFGVAQREELVRKGRYPHLLVMTATPIPRTLGLTLYGDLDVSVMNQPPPGRKPVRTYIRSPKDLPNVWSFIRQKLKEGRQVYVVYPRVEGAEPDLKAVKKEFETLEQNLRPFKIGMVYGSLDAREKERVMTSFRANMLQVLLSTSLIEVGVDVPNASVMLIENANQFGLAQLHQLRGRIGRGEHESFCILSAGSNTPESRQRLKIMEETTEGFRIAEADLAMRGPGELLGQEQSGAPRFRFGDLARDIDLIELARKMASQQSAQTM